MKTKTIVLTPSRFAGSSDYIVLQVTDTTEFRPGDTMTKKKADELCIARDWKVTMKQAPAHG